MKEEIIEIIEEILYAKQGTLSEDTLLDDIIQDSMEVIELIAVLSNKYDLTVSPQAMNDIETVGDLIAFVKENQKTRGEVSDLDAF